MTYATTPSALGFDNPVFDATATYRTVLEAMSRPASVQLLPVTPDAPTGIGPASAAVLLTLADMETPIWIAPDVNTAELRNYLHFHTGCPLTAAPETAAFALLGRDSDLTIIDRLAVGTAEYPDRSATVIIDCENLGSTEGQLFTGPGIKETATFDIPGFPPAIWDLIDRNQALFPLGIDWIFTGGSHMVALPRTSKRGSETCM